MVVEGWVGVGEAHEEGEAQKSLEQKRVFGTISDGVRNQKRAKFIQIRFHEMLISVLALIVEFVQFLSKPRIKSLQTFFFFFFSPIIGKSIHLFSYVILDLDKKKVSVL